VWELIRLANRHPRVNILQPGPGVGGHCIAVDPWFIVESSPKYSKIIKDAREVNDFKPKWVNEKIKQIVEGFVLEYKREPKICVFGISFKPDIDDLRESPALSIALDVAMKYKGISIVEPNINDLPADFKGSDASLVLIQDLKTDIDIPIILVKHKQFDDLKGRLSKCKYLLDTVGLIGE
jgi:UDP-N-acetyl-D-mannosaminuronic acid dehydrogenase